MDPVSAGGAKAAEVAATELSKGLSDVLVRMFGPPADEVGEYLRRKAHYRLNNAERIAEKALRKAKKSGREGGRVAPRLSYTMLEEGTYSDDELMAEYLGGVLASGRTPAGKDDRGVTWTKLITSMSSMQIRGHFILYREWANAIRGSDNRKLAADPGLATMYVDLLALVTILLKDHPDVQPNSVVGHVIGGLARLNLIGPVWMSGSTADVDGATSEMPFTHALRVRPTYAGIELYGWACGHPGFGFEEFMALPEVISFDTPIQRPAIVVPEFPSEAP